MTTKLATREPIPITKTPHVTADQVELIRKTIAKDATADELKLYLYDCARLGVHPLDKLLHFTKRGGKYTPITSIDLMHSRAEETGEYAGSDDYVFEGDPGKPGFKAISTVYRLVQGQRVPFTRSARWEEYCPPSGQDHMWRKMPHVMLGKCSQAAALRVGFPRQLHGLYVREEMDQALAPSAEPFVEAPLSDSETACLPEGAVLIKAVLRGSGKVLGSIVTHAGEELPFFKAQVQTLAEQLCQEHTPAVLKIGIGPKTGKPYLAEIHRVPSDATVLEANATLKDPQQQTAF